MTPAGRGVVFPGEEALATSDGVGRRPMANISSRRCPPKGGFEPRPYGTWLRLGARGHGFVPLRVPACAGMNRG